VRMRRKVERENEKHDLVRMVYVRGSIVSLCLSGKETK
jgi:hypothetical protein